MLKLKSKREVLELAELLKAKDLTVSTGDELEIFVNGFVTDEIYGKEKPYWVTNFIYPVTPIACSVGTYGVNSLLVQNKEGEFGYVGKRNSLLIQLL